MEPTGWLLASLVALIGLHLLCPVARLIPRPFNYAGALLVAGGLALNLWADRCFHRARTTVKPSETPTSLIAAGPFRFSRHPMYLGMSAVLAGAAVLLGTLAPWAVVAVFVGIMDRCFVPYEERAMRDAFGESYNGYSRRVRRWL
jgi:protein-S-isoprenylcysteine O-methyltransferase Ste14